MFRRLRKKITRWQWITLFIFTVGAISIPFFQDPDVADWFDATLRGPNIHVVHEDHLIRSAQLTTEELKNAVEKFDIKTVVNLRGEHHDRPWWQEEQKLLEDMNIRYENIFMSADRLPHRAHLIQLLDVYKDAPRPILIHCRAGADRTGEASAIYQMEYMGMSKERALESLSWDYFHIDWSKPAKKYFVKLYEGEQWARENYDPCEADYRYYDKEKYCPKSQ